MAGLFSNIKNVGLAIAKKMVTVTGKFVFSVGRIVGELGSTLFSVTNTLSYMLKQENPPFKLLVYLPFAVANFFVNASIRVPSLITRFGKPHQPESEPIPLNIKGKFFYYGLTTTGMFSMLFASAKSYLDGIVLLEFIISQVYGDAYYKNSRLVTNLIIAGAVALACSKGFSFYTYNLASIKDNSQKYAEKIQEGDWEWDRTMSLTLALSALNLLGSTLGGYFSMDKAMNKMPGIRDAPEKLKETIAGFSATTAFISALTSSVPTLQARLESYNNNEEADNVKKPEITSCWGTPLKVGTLFCGAVDTLRESAGNVPAMASTLNKVFKKAADPTIIYHPAVITVAVLTAISSGVLSYTFGVLKGWDDLVKIWLNKQDIYDFEADYAYQPLPDSEFDAKNPMHQSACINIDDPFEPEGLNERLVQSYPANLPKAHRQHDAFFSLPDQDDINNIQDPGTEIPLGRSLRSLPSHRRSIKEPTYDYSLNC